ncbi:uncharacterized protein LOC105701623 [Orussus abietinus]|uniref:uncharacterized protein LOC105701623 n=1 Tax=Orussus abietinus TaxID=222816 RepID=UPI000625F407|nr:uncharacterized protein LOC105701623 [Orussus abietinus]
MSASKRQRASTCATSGEEATRSHTLDTLPPEVLEMVLHFLPMHDVATSVRLVSRRCSVVATSVLNAAFLLAGVRLDRTMSHLEAAMPRVETESDLLARSKAFNALELVRSQYEMLKAVTWRYTHPPRREKRPRLCFYAGLLLDELDELIRLARTRPAALADAGVPCFVALCKRFMNYFEKVSERGVNRSALVSGCKTVDVLDCLAEGRRVVSLAVTSGRGGRSGSVVMKVEYVMRRAWFTCLEVPCAADENSWRDEQRFMYLRLRRLVGSVNEHLFEKSHYERERLFRATPKPPPASTYSGYGEYGGRFFYYGNMNRYAYESKFKFAEAGAREDPEDETEEGAERAPSFDLVVSVDLRCSPELAPLAVGKALESADLDAAPTNEHLELYLKVDVACPASVANRLPGHFTWELRSPRRGRPSP